jgi:hypothetical protein
MATSTVTRSESSGPVLQSRTTVAAIRAAFARTKELQEQIAGANRKLSLVQSKPATLELMGKDPATEVRTATVEVQRLESQLSGAKSELAQLFLSERKNFDDARGRLLNEFRKSTIDPAIKQFLELTERVDAMITELVNKLDSTGGSNEADSEVDSFDAGIVSWNRLCGECAGPSNARIDASDSIRISGGQIYFRSSMAPGQRLAAQIAKLRDTLENTQRRIERDSLVKK